MKDSIDVQREVASVLSARRIKAASVAAERFSEVCEKIPEYSDADEAVKRIGVRLGRLAIEGGKGSEKYSLIQQELSKKSEERKALLVSGGFAPDFLENVYTCPLCKDTGERKEDGLQSSICSCYMKLYTEKLQKESNVASNVGFEAFLLKYYSKDTSTGNASPFDKAALALAKAKHFVETFGTDDAKDILFTGGPGVGKSFLCSCIANELMKKGVPVLYISSAELFDTLTYYGKDEERNSKRELLEKISTSVDLLILDDLGAEKQSAARYGILLDVLNRRAANKNKRTVISANLSLQKLKNVYYDERVFSRLVSFEICELTGDDIRIIKKFENAGV